MTERVLNLVTNIQWEKPQVIEYDKICNGLKALSEILSIYSYMIIPDIPNLIYIYSCKYMISYIQIKMSKLLYEILYTKYNIPY